MKRFAVLVAWVLVLGAAAVGALSSAESAVAQQTTGSSGLCDTAQVEQFTDIADGDYAAAYVLCMRALGLSVGAGAGTYGPDRELNRGQMASFLVRLWRDVLGKDCPTGVVIPFTDVAGSTHATNIECLFGLGITTGTGPDTYGPRDPLKATQISRFLYRVYQNAGGDMCPGADGAELDRATECLLQLRVVPTTAEATSTGAVTRAQMGVYVVGLWHNLSGRGLPPPPPPFGTPTPVAVTTTTQPAAQSALRIAYTVFTSEYGNQELRISDADGGNTSTIDFVNIYGGLVGWSSAGTHVAYVAMPEGADQLWVVDADGTNPTKIADNALTGGGWLPDGTHINYRARTDEGDQLWVAGADGSNPTQLVDTTYVDTWRWSPDSTRLAFESRAAGGWGDTQVWVVDADGSNPTKVADNIPERNDSYGWSPDSTRVGYLVLNDDGSHQLWVVDADGANPTELADESGDWGWSPDGDRIAYIAGRYHPFSVAGQLWVAGADGANPTKLTDESTGWAWSPDSTSVAYPARTQSGTQLWVAGADGSNPTKLTDGDGKSVAWSPDSTRIAYQVNTPEGGQLWVVGADGSNPTKVTETSNNWSPSGNSVWWSPDSNRVAYTSGGLWVAGADGSNPTNLDPNSPGGLDLAWSPDGDHIAYAVRNFDGPGQLSVVRADGSSPAKQLTDSLGSWGWSERTRQWSWREPPPPFFG